MPATNSAIQQALKKMFHLTNYGLDTEHLYIGLSTTIIDYNGLGAIEPKDVSYKRVAIPRNSTGWKLVDDILIGNNVAIQFLTATRDWGRIKEIFISTENGGQLDFEDEVSVDKKILFHTKLENDIVILKGMKLVLPLESIWAKGGE